MEQDKTIGSGGDKMAFIRTQDNWAYSCFLRNSLNVKTLFLLEILSERNYEVLLVI